MVVVANKSIFGGGQYSVAGSEQLRWVGRKRWPIYEIRIKKAPAGRRGKDGVMRPGWEPPYLPATPNDRYHPTGNSVGYMLQTAHLMGCNPIYLLGFTMASGTGYFFGLTNPVTRRRSFYSDPDLPIHYLKWYCSQHPGRLKLWPGWQGPIYDAGIEVLDAREAERLVGLGCAGRREPEPHSGHDVGVQ